MKDRILKLIDDFHERELPKLVARNSSFAEIGAKADVAIGMRRAGKTWFCYQKMAELISSGVEKSRIVYINFEDDRLLDFDVSHFQEILDVYFGKYPEHKDLPCFFFFDEIQRIDKWEIFIRRLLDTENVRVYLTGSSSKLLSSEIATSLRGRSITTEIFPYSFIEFLKCHKKFTEIPKTLGEKTRAVLRKSADEYLERGGFPEVQTVHGDTRTRVLQGYVDSVLLKDIVERHHVGNITALKYLVRHLMDSSGRKFSVNKFYNTLKSLSVKCAKNSLYEYLDHLTDAFMFYKVPIHSRSEKSRMINPVKIYAVDTGLLNAMTFRHSSDYGPLLENMVFMHLRRNSYEIEYVNTKGGYETDFFARHKVTGKIQLIQVCWNMSDKKTFGRELRGLNSAMQEFAMSEGTIVTWDDEGMLDNDIRVIPVWKWMLEEI